MNRPFISLAAAALGAALVLSGCSVQRDDETKKPKAEPSPELPTGNVEVPAEVTLTKAGETLAFGEAAMVAHQANAQRNSVLELKVLSAQQGRISDLAAYQLSAEAKKSTPYYVKVSVTNAGTGDLSRTGIPLYGVDSGNSLNQQYTFNNTFAKCPSQLLPSGFTAGKSVSTCLVYIMRPSLTMTKVSYRPLQAFPPISWQGTITPPPVEKKAKKKKQQGQNQGQP